MIYKYGTFTNNQIALTKAEIRKQIFFLLLCADPKTKDEYEYVNLNEAFNGLLYKLGGLNSILGEPQELVDVISLLEEALIIYNKPTFNFKIYRKLILNAGALTNNIKEVD